MRLVCPSCDAQYEVDAGLIPSSGRDVQCSNCGKTWFQEPLETIRLAPEARVDPDRPESGLTDEAAAFFAKGGSGADEAYEDELPGPMPELHDEEAGIPAAAMAAEPEPEPEPEPVPEPEPAVAAAEAPAAKPERSAQRPEIDAAVLGILKAEAEREIAARRAEVAAGTESQPDSDMSREAVARLRGADEEEDDAEADAAAARRKALLPDIEEINSTLTATSDRAIPAVDEIEAAEETYKRRSGFRMGFSLVLLAVVLLILAYLFAPQIGAAVPGLKPALASYVDWANGIRQSVDGYLERSVKWLTDLFVEMAN